MISMQATRRLAKGSTAVAACLMLSACGGVLDPQGPVGRANRSILIDSVVIMLLIVVPTILAVVGTAWWFRASNTKAKFRPDWAYSGRLEMITWSIPVMVILFLGGITWIGAHDLEPSKPLVSKVKAVDVEVISLDWKWLFIYPEQGLASVNELTVPVGTPVHFHITSASVMNTFFIPQLGSMIYAMNGMATQLFLQGDKVGVYHGQSSHYSGDGFSDMYFNVNVVSSADYAKWATQAKSSGPTLDRASYTELAKQSLKVKPFTYRSVEPGIFDALIKQTIGQAPGPQEGDPSPEVTPKHEGK